MGPAADPTIVDTATLDRARGGDTEALTDIWITYQPQLLRMLRARGRPTAEDIASQVWIDVGRNLDRFHGDGTAFRSWIFTIAGRRSIDEIRRDTRRAGLVDRPGGSTLTAEHDVEPLDQSLDGVHALLGALPAAAAEVVLLRVVHDMTVADVAAITGRSATSVRVATHRALERLRGTYDPASSGDDRDCARASQRSTADATHDSTQRSS